MGAMEYYDDDDVNNTAIFVLYFVASTLSLIGSGLIILSYIFIKDLRRFPYTIVFFLSLCDFCFSLKFFISAVYMDNLDDIPDALCNFQGVWAQFWGMGSISWNGVISLNIMLEIRNPFMQSNRYVPFYHIYVWLVCLGTTIALWASDNIGPSGDGTCWIDNDAGPWQLLFFGPLILYFCSSFLCLFLAATQLRKINGYQVGQRRTFLRMILFVVVFISIWMEPLLHRICQAFGYDAAWMEYLDAVCVSIQGAANAAVWLSSPYFISRVRRSEIFVCYKHCSVKRAKESKKVKEDETAPLMDNDLGQQARANLRKNIMHACLCGIRGEVQHTETVYKPDKRYALADFDTFSTVKDFTHGDKPNPEVANFNRLFTFRSFAPEVFMDLRQHQGVENEDYLRSLEPALVMSTFSDKYSEGRSGSFFVFSPDKRFIIKTIEASEATLLRHILHKYHKYMMQNDSMVVQFQGLYCIYTGIGQAIYLIAMSNLFFRAPPIHRRYDLKGSWVRREVGERHARDPSVLGMDRDFANRIGNIQISDEERQRLLHVISEDALFLKSLGIIDYSLLVGIHYTAGIMASEPDLEDLLARGETRGKKLKRDSDSGSEYDGVPLSPLECVEEEYSDEEEGRRPSFSAPLLELPKMPGVLRSREGDVIYFLGIIDVLQLYDCNKFSERLLKVYIQGKDKDGVSVQPPMPYCQRFVQAAARITTSRKTASKTGPAPRK